MFYKPQHSACSTAAIRDAHASAAVRRPPYPRPPPLKSVQQLMFELNLNGNAGTTTAAKPAAARNAATSGGNRSACGAAACVRSDGSV